ncbi:MAG: PHP domain-containing protein [Spirochaetaceae bacterium]|nr:MAG: PHP domain-containing protein [Spirochaetaceae bacterium]
MVDLHTHSTASDGALSPGQLLAACHLNGIKTVALTDHDTIDGVDEAARAAQPYGIEVIAGIELEIDYSGPGAFHLLGLGMRGSSPELEALLEHILRLRNARNVYIVEQIRAAGIRVDIGDVGAFAGGDILARPHFARFLVDRGLARTIQDAFDRYLGDGRPFWQAKQAVGLPEAAAAIHSAGGKAVVAHPMTLYLSINAAAERFAQWKDQGLDGLEAYHAGARLNDCLRLEAVADTLGLMVSAGSDFHGPERIDRRLGHTADGIAIEDRFADGFARYSPAHSEDNRVDTR